MKLMTETAIAEVVIRRLGARWFIGVLLGTFVCLYLIAARSGPDMLQQLTDNANHGMIFINICVLLLVTVISATEIPYDVSGRVLLVLLSKPIRRYQYITGKALGVAAAGAIFVIISSLFLFVCLNFFGSNQGLLILQAMIMACLRVILATGVAILLSSAFSEIPTIAGCVAGGVVSAGIGQFALLVLKLEIPSILKLIISPLVYVVPSITTLTTPPTILSDFFSGQKIDYSKIQNFSFDSILSGGSNAIPYALIYCLGYTCVFLALAIFLFRKNEKVE